MRKADNLTTILSRCYEIWESYLPGTLWVPPVCNGTDLPLDLCIKRLKQYFFINIHTQLHVSVMLGHLQDV